MIAELGFRLGTVDGPTAGTAEVWCARVGEHAADVDRFSESFLSVSERARLREYRVRDAAERYVVTRSLVRVVLGERLAVPPRDVIVSRTDLGKPILSEDLHFNVSHSGDLVLLAVSADRPIGVDVERRREVLRVEALIARWLDDREKREVADRLTAGAQLSDAFLRVWSLKEARLKALGVGISGAARASFAHVDALPIDHLLGRIEGGSGTGYVGAVAFA